jgi:hypothetical protein
MRFSLATFPSKRHRIAGGLKILGGKDDRGISWRKVGRASLCGPLLNDDFILVRMRLGAFPQEKERFSWTLLVGLDQLG